MLRAVRDLLYNLLIALFEFAQVRLVSEVAEEIITAFSSALTNALKYQSWELDLGSSVFPIP